MIDLDNSNIFSSHFKLICYSYYFTALTMAHFHHLNFHNLIGHYGPKGTPRQHSEKKTPKVTAPATPETASEIQSQKTTKRMLRSVDLRLVPIPSLLYLLCFLCRQNIGNAKTFHMTYDLHLTTQ